MAGKVAVVTGAARGQGAAAVRLLLSEGCRVVAADVRDDEARDMLVGLPEDARPRAMYAHLDVTDEGQWERAVAAAEARYGGVDVLVNNAGIIRARGLEATEDWEWERVIAVDQKGAFLGMRAVIPCFRRRGGGAVVNVSSVYGVIGTESQASYHAAKGALRAMTRQAAVELAPLGVRVNAVLPGVIDTPMMADAPPETLERLMARTPLHRLGRADEVAWAVLFLASDEASFVTGAELAVDGGYLAT
jgi:NAD(P)-dependent dehydrogenase (short-subunit alcohol dehydrogenase family)